MKRGLVTLLLVISAIAAFGLTFHFFGSAEMVPEASRRFGFWALSPLAVIDRIYALFTGQRLIWGQVPMFLVLWAAYAFLSISVSFLILRRKHAMRHRNNPS